MRLAQIKKQQIVARGEEDSLARRDAAERDNVEGEDAREDI